MVLGDGGAQLRPAERFGDGQPSALDARTLQRILPGFADLLSSRRRICY
jgi:hypothetical protein